MSCYHSLVILHKIWLCLAYQPSDLIFEFLAILHISFGLFHLENYALGQWTNCAFVFVAKVSWTGKHPWSRPFPDRSISMCPVLKLKNITSGKYSPISTASALQKAKGLMWGFFLVKTPMFIECFFLHCFLSWSSMIHISMKFLSLSMQVMVSFLLYSVSLTSLLSLP